MEWSSIIFWINCVIALLFFICYAYQFAYIPIPFFKKAPEHKPVMFHRYAVLIAARNEENVIGHLIDSILEQDYPKELISIFVVADNCTDNTAEVARRHGATVYERFNQQEVGKGYAVECLLDWMEQDGHIYEGYMIFDADNLLSPNYVTELNKTFSDGHNIITTYRNSKNFGDNWISAGYGIQFLREAVLLNNPRFLVGSSAAVSGTGFAFSREILKECGGWPFHLLTEDIEFTIHSIINGHKVAYCKDAVYFDEQPTTFRQSWNQRMRWVKGYIQVFQKYGMDLLKGMFSSNGFSCYDMTMNNIPGIFLTGISFLVNIGGLVLTIISGQRLLPMLLPIFQMIFNSYFVFFLMGAIVVSMEWKHIYTSTAKKLLGVVTFPIFMLSYIPLSVAALFRKVEWKPIQHSVSVSIKELDVSRK